MAGLDRKGTRSLLRELEKQGATVKRTKKGYLVRCPQGGLVTLHLSNSDHRSTRNIKSLIAKQGLQWPSWIN